MNVEVEMDAIADPVRSGRAAAAPDAVDDNPGEAPDQLQAETRSEDLRGAVRDGRRWHAHRLGETQEVVPKGNVPRVPVGLKAVATKPDFRHTCV